MTRTVVRSMFVCLLVLLACIGCQKKAEPTAEAPTSKPPQSAGGDIEIPDICKTAKDNCGNLSQCAMAPLGAAATAIPERPCTLQGQFNDTTQQLVDVYSWNIFLALNWPGNSASCDADQNKNITAVQSGDGTYTVWQTFMPGENVFVNPGYEKPAAWCSGNGLTLGAKRTFANIAKATSNAADLKDPKLLLVAEPGKDVLQAKGGVVTDQAGRWLRYERLMNKVEYDYIVPDRWNAPQLTAMYQKGDAIRIPQGAIEIKSAWKILTDDEIKLKKYFTTQATVCNTPDDQKTPCDDQPVTMGLVGLHIVHQVNEGGTMFWSTFEHVDNDTVFFDPKSNAAPNTNFAKQPYTELDASCKPLNMPTQIKRVTPIPSNVKINNYYQQLLAGSVFANYRVISTQWTAGVGVTAAGTPQNVANIVLETYAQEVVEKKNGATGCLACHFYASTRIKNAQDVRQDANHSFFFLQAQYATMPPKKPTS